MTVVMERTAAGAPAPPPPPGADRRRRLVVMAAAVLLLMALVRVVTGADDLTSSGTFGAALRLAVPIGLAGLGGLFAERAGVVNIGLEGMMILGTWFGAWAGWEYGVWWGVLFGLAAGALGGLLHALATVTFGVDHVISGVAINILGGGLARYLSVVAYDPSTGGGATQSPQVDGDIGVFTMPLTSGGSLLGWDSPDPLGWLEDKGWFLLSDVAGLAKGLTSNVSLFTLVALALFPLAIWVLWRTAFGLRLRSVGESPVAAESLGVNVYRMKYFGVVISGALAGLAGAFLVTVAANIYREGQTQGRGFIGLAAMIFGNWRPAGAAVGAALFGYADALQLRQREAVHALLLFVAVLLAVLAVRSVLRRKVRNGVVAAVAGAGFAAWYLASDTVPSQFVNFTPHLTTLFVLAAASQRLRPPAADGQPYRKGQAK